MRLFSRKHLPAPSNLAELPKKIKEKLDFTPDYWELAQHEKQLLFAYSKLAQPEAFPSMAHAYTFDRFQFWEKEMKDAKAQLPYTMKVPFPDKKPIVDFNRETRRSWGGVVPKRIEGRIIALRPKDFLVLDKLRENGVQFYRRRVRLVVPYFEYQRREQEGTTMNSCESKVTIIRAWMYIGVKGYWGTDLKYTQDMREVSQVETIEKIGEYYVSDS
jgi:hypothetical protein